MLPRGMQEVAVLLYTLVLLLTFPSTCTARTRTRSCLAFHCRMRTLLVILVVSIVLLLLTQATRAATRAVPCIGLLGLALAFYLMPELSHSITGERAQLQFSSLTWATVVVNIVYLLPFSAMALVKAPRCSVA